MVKHRTISPTEKVKNERIRAGLDSRFWAKVFCWRKLRQQLNTFQVGNIILMYFEYYIENH